MFRNTKIRTRLVIMAIGPAVPALVILILAWAMLPKVMITGTTYKEIIAGKNFVTDATAMQLDVVTIHTLVQRVANEPDTATVRAGLRGRIESTWKDYTTLYNAWEGKLYDVQSREALSASHDAALDYFRQYTELFKPALDNRRVFSNDPVATDVLHNKMEKAISIQQAKLSEATHRVEIQVADQEQSAKDQLPLRMAGVIGVTLLVVAASIALGITVVRSITERVRRLNEVATVELPRVVEEVKRASLAGEEIPAMPQQADTGDELADAARAFNSVVATAVDLAAEQSRVRRATAQMFVNLGRRNHKLLSRTLTYISQLESDERDPATLQNLFRLDHLTTRMRRHAESLLVLAGSPPLRTWSRPVPVSDVLRAALSEIETYDRVDIKELEAVEVRGASVSDLAHLLAELLENATAFSPPQTRVRVLGRTDADGYTIVVVDEGIGMSAQELSAANTLINSSDFAGLLGDSRMLGLGVVGRLAARHGFRVNLTASPVGGVVAWVALPTSALAPRRATEAEGMPGLPGGMPAQSGAAQLESSGQVTPSPTFRIPGGRPVQPATTGSGGQPLELPLRRLPGQAEDPTAAPPAGPYTPAPYTPAPSAPAAAPAAMPAAASGGPGERSDGGRTGTNPFALPQLPGGGPSRSVPRHAPAGGGVPGADGPGEMGGLKRRVRGAQLPDTGVPAPTVGRGGMAATPVDRPDRSADSVRAGLASFAAGRRSAAGASSPAPSVGSLSPAFPNRAQPAAQQPGQHPSGAVQQSYGQAAPQRAAYQPMAQPAEPVSPTAAHWSATPSPVARAVVPESAGVLPRRVRGAQLPTTDVPAATPPAQERSATDVRTALSNFVAGRRAAENDH